MSNLEEKCLAMVIKTTGLETKYGEVVVCVQTMPVDSVINNGRFGHQTSTKAGMWWVLNRNGSWLEHESNLIRLYDGDADDEMLKVTGKPPTLGVTA